MGEYLYKEIFNSIHTLGYTPEVWSRGYQAARGLTGSIQLAKALVLQLHREPLEPGEEGIPGQNQPTAG